MTNATYTVRDGYMPDSTMDQSVPPENPHQGYHVSYPIIRKGWRIKLQHRYTKEIRYYTDWHKAQKQMKRSFTGDPSSVDNDWFLVDVLDAKAWSSLSK